MRGRGSRLTRALVTWAGMLAAVLAAAGDYSVAQAQRPGETADQTALAVPRIGLRGAAGVGLPQPLSPSEAAQVRRIFSLQGAGSVAEAARETERLQNDLLLGAILADRYLRGRPTTAELAAWLARFGDQPEAPAIRGLLERLAPGATAPQAADPLPTPPSGERAGPARLDRCSCRTATPRRSPPPGRGRPTPRRCSSVAWPRCGLARVDAAALFEAAYRTASTPALRAAGAFWAARVAQRGGDRGKFAVWMRRAALEGDTFYGLIARRALGPAVACIAARDDRQRRPGGAAGDAAGPPRLRAAAGRREAPRRGGTARAVGGYRSGMACSIARSSWRRARWASPSWLPRSSSNGMPRPDGASLVRLRPASGFLVDPPLVYALVRHELNFHAAAVSSSGARGLMQIMPSTAHAVAGGQARASAGSGGQPGDRPAS